MAESITIKTFRIHLLESSNWQEKTGEMERASPGHTSAMALAQCRLEYKYSYLYSSIIFEGKVEVTLRVLSICVHLQYDYVPVYRTTTSLRAYTQAYYL